MVTFYQVKLPHFKSNVIKSMEDSCTSSCACFLDFCISKFYCIQYITTFAVGWVILRWLIFIIHVAAAVSLHRALLLVLNNLL